MTTKRWTPVLRQSIVYSSSELVSCGAEPSWWVGVSRADWPTAVQANLPRMAASREGQWVEKKAGL